MCQLETATHGRDSPSCTSVVDEDGQTVSLLLDFGHEVIAALLILQIPNNLAIAISRRSSATQDAIEDLHKSTCRDPACSVGR